MACPRDTNGDGNCGQPLCPHCGPVYAHLDRCPHPTCSEPEVHGHGTDLRFRPRSQ